MKKTKVTDTRDGNQATKAKAAIVVNAAQYPATPASPLKTAGTTDLPSSQAFGVPVSVAEAVMAAAWPLARTPGYADLSAEIHKVSAAYIDQNASAVLSLVTMLLSGPNYAAYTPDSSKILTMARGVGRRSSGILLAAHVNGVLRGFFAGEVRTMVFCKELIGFEHAFFVHPDLRAPGLGAALLTCFEKCVCELGGSAVQYVHTSGINPEAAGRAYAKGDSQKIGEVWRKALP